MLYFLGKNYSKVDLNYAMFRSLSCNQPLIKQKDLKEAVCYLDQVMSTFPSLDSLHLDDVLSETKNYPNQHIESYLKKIINIKESCLLSEVKRLSVNAYVNYQLPLTEILKNVANKDKNLSEFEISFDNTQNIIYLESAIVKIIAKVYSTAIELVSCIDHQTQENYVFNLVFDNYTEFSTFINNYRELYKTNSNIIEIFVC